MVAKKSIDVQLQQIDNKLRVFGRTELKQLRRILNPGETIGQCVYGFYQGGSGLLVATDKRVLLIDKRPFYLYVEDHSYDSVSRVDFVSRMLQGVLYFETDSKLIIFKSVSDAKLSKLEIYVQGRISKQENLTDSPTVISSVVKKPYLNPAWRPHHVTAQYRRPRLSKFHTAGQ